MPPSTPISRWSLTLARCRGLAAEHSIRRYGFHGIAHTAMLRGWSGQGRAISLQLGGAEAVLFGGGMGENAGEVRSRILSGRAQRRRARKQAFANQ